MLKWFTKQQSSEATAKHQKQEERIKATSSSELTDADYDFLFNQLLDGVAHGWNQFKVIKFFNNLGARGQEDHWVAWLEKFATKIPDTPNDSQRRLGAIMLRLAEVTQSAAQLNQLSTVSSTIGKKLFFGNISNLVWEYEGVDIVTPDTPDTTTASEDNVPEAKIEHSPEKDAVAIFESASGAKIEEVDTSEEKQTESIQLDEPTTIVKNSELSKEVVVIESENVTSSQLQEPLIPVFESNSEDKIPEEFLENQSSKEQETAIHQFEKSQSITENNNSNNSTNEVMKLVESWFNLGLKQANAGDLSGAINSWHEALKLNPNLAEIWHNLGSALGRLEHYPEAIDSFNHALEIAPQSEYAWNDRAHAFYQMQQWEQAIESWNQAISINPGNHQFWYHYGSALEQLQRLDEAIASYAKALEISPNFQPARSKYTNLIKES